MIKSTLAALCAILSVASSAHAYSFAPSKEEATKGAPELRDDVKFQEKSIMREFFNMPGKIVLTFDDGPNEKTTPIVLNILEQYNIKATFFIQGSNVQTVGQLRLLERMKAEKHIVANHTYGHKDLSVRSNEAAFDQIASTHNVISRFMDGSGANWFFRAPYGAWKASHASQLNRSPVLGNYIGPIYWTAGGDLSCVGKCGPGTEASEIKTAADWACWGKKVPIDICATGYLKEIYSESRRGGVVLLHDIHLKTAQMLPMIIDDLLAKGYTFTNLDDRELNLKQYRDELILRRK